MDAFISVVMPIPVLCGAAVLGIGSKVFRAVGFALQKSGYTHIQGEAHEKALDSQDPYLKMMTWNIFAKLVAGCL
jgi:hypothetical protein